MNDPKTPSACHDCPNCGAPAYIGGPGMPTQCTSRECPFYSEDCWVRWVMEIPDDETGVEFDIEDEDTQPWIKVPTLADLYANKGGYKQHFTPKQQKAMDILDAAIDKIPVPYWTKPLDKDDEIE